MESPTASAASADLPAPTFSQVVFIDIPQSYPPLTPITCRYTLNAAVKPNSRDWVGIFKVGWSTMKDYHTFVWVEPYQDVGGQQTSTRQAVFKEYYLPKDEIEFYQFCYVDSGGQVRGASTPFCFRNPAEQSGESSTDDDLLVIITQEQVDHSVREKAELQKELDQMKAENETLRSALLREQKETDCFKELNDQRLTDQAELAEEMDQIKEENKKLKGMLQLQTRENDRLKEEVMMQLAKQMEIQEQNSTEQERQSHSLSSSRKTEKYDQAVMKINQLKEEREELKKKVDAQSEEITKLKAKLREGERELFKTTDGIQLLQVDLQSSEKEKERLTAELQRLKSLKHNMDEVKRENQELCKRLSQHETLQSAPNDDLKVQCQKLARQLQQATEETRNTKRQAEFLEQELQQCKKQLTDVVASYEHERQINGKHEMQLRDMNVMMIDKDIKIEDKDNRIMLVTKEKEELTKENKELRDDIEELHRAYRSHDADSAYLHPNIVSPAADASATRDQQETQEETEHLYDTIDNIEEQQLEEEERSLVCRHCQETFPGITRAELEQHEQSHRVCPFCTMICDYMEQSVFEDHVYGHEL
ncbi:calcium-binding and coiled-coil domain-containing protein 2 isoform X2 [Leuresthes tenuis]|uniref:calcium-binding and coiled-coil domain-containing protein 2 isoform X2 n=1 Tax=Leuresthes tenuis TaxID=355514 RepID=UPI003B50BECC